MDRPGTRRRADDHYEKMLKELGDALELRASKPDITLRTLRVAAEELCLCALRTVDPAWERRDKPGLDGLLNDPTLKKAWVDDDTKRALALVRDITNPAAHGSGREAAESEALSALIHFAGPFRRLHEMLARPVPAHFATDLRRLERITPPGQPARAAIPMTPAASPAVTQVAAIQHPPAQVDPVAQLHSGRTQPRWITDGLLRISTWRRRLLNSHG